MKRILSTVIMLIAGFGMQAQNIEDAYRYSKTELNGTARFIGMSGAFGALGGDISAISVNPASSAVFLNSTATISLTNRSLDSDIYFNNGSTTLDQSDLDLGNLGGVFVFKSNEQKNWRKFSLGINYNSSANFDESYSVNGSSNNSIDTYFLENANGVSLDLLQRRDNESISDLYSFLGENYGFIEQQAFLGYQGYIIEANEDDPNNTEYFSLVEPGTFNQRYQYAATGLNGKVSFNLATQYQDWLYLGLNLNSHFLNYEKSSEIAEFNTNAGADNPNATTEIYFGNNISTNGEGFSFQLGSIFRVGEVVRLGYTFQSPTWLNIREETSQYLETNSNANDFVSIAPNIINIYPDYTLQIPATHTASISFLFGKSGLISGDFGYTDYSNLKFKPESDLLFQNLNNQIEEELRAVPTVKIGGEYRIANLSLRAGFRHEKSPFEDNRQGDLSGYSGGVGYSFGNLNLDLAYMTTSYDEYSSPLSGGSVNPVSFDRNLSQFVATLTLGL